MGILSDNLIRTSDVECKQGSISCIQYSLKRVKDDNIYSLRDWLESRKRLISLEGDLFEQ